MNVFKITQDKSGIHYLNAAIFILEHLQFEHLPGHMIVIQMQINTMT